MSEKPSSPGTYYLIRICPKCGKEYKAPSFSTTCCQDCWNQKDNLTMSETPAKESAMEKDEPVLGFVFWLWLILGSVWGILGWIGLFSIILGVWHGKK